MGKKQDKKEIIENATKVIENLDNEFLRISESLQILITLMGLCTVIIWKSLDFFKYGTVLDDSNQLFFVSFVVSSICLVFLIITAFSVFIDPEKLYRKALCSGAFLVSIALAICTIFIVVIQVHTNLNLKGINDFANYFPIITVPVVLLISALYIGWKIRKSINSHKILSKK